MNEDNRFDPTRSETLAEALPREIARCKEVKEAYCEIGPAGVLGAYLIDLAIEEAESATKNGDVIGMLISYEKLKGVE